MNSDNKEMYMPLGILRIYYHTLSGATEVHDTATQTMWLLTELHIEQEKKSGDDLIEVDTTNPLTFQAIQQVSNSGDKVFDSKRTLERLNSILNTIDQLEQDMLKQSKDRDELLVVKEVSSPVILSAEHLKGIDESDRGRSENTKKKREADELWLILID